MLPETENGNLPVPFVYGFRIPVDIKDAALCAGVKYGGPVAWDIVLRTYVESKLEIDRRSALSALACSANPNILARSVRGHIRYGIPIAHDCPPGVRRTTDSYPNNIDTRFSVVTCCSLIYWPYRVKKQTFVPSWAGSGLIATIYAGLFDYYERQAFCLRCYRLTVINRECGTKSRSSVIVLDG